MADRDCNTCAHFAQDGGCSAWDCDYSPVRTEQRYVITPLGIFVSVLLEHGIELPADEYRNIFDEIIGAMVRHGYIEARTEKG